VNRHFQAAEPRSVWDAYAVLHDLFFWLMSSYSRLPSAREHLRYGDCLEVKRNQVHEKDNSSLIGKIKGQNGKLQFEFESSCQIHVKGVCHLTRYIYR